MCVPVLLLAAGVRAQDVPDTDDEAYSLFAAGEQAFASGSYERALDYFEQAYALSARPGLLYNIAITADRMRRDARALEAFRAYLAAEPDTDLRAQVQARIAFLERAVAGEAEGEDPPRDEPVPPPPSEGGVHPAGIGVLIGAGALFVSFGILAGLSEAEDESLASSCGRNAGGVCPPGAIAALDAYNLGADISWIAGSVAAVVGVVLLFVLPPEHDTEAEPLAASVRVAPWASPEGAGIGAVGRW